MVMEAQMKNGRLMSFLSVDKEQGALKCKKLKSMFLQEQTGNII